MLRVGLTGGIGSGKGEVARRLASYGALVIDADQLAREVVAPGTPGLAEIAQAFGTRVLRPDGDLDRQLLGEIVFSDADLRGRLNAIVHPRVGDRMREIEQAAGKADVIVQVIPLLVENGLAGTFDVVVVVDAPPAAQVDRLVSTRGMTRSQALARMSAQVTREERLAAATLVVDNSGSLDDLDGQVAALWAELSRRAEKKDG
jgi:dephospho-CoA kinase